MNTREDAVVVVGAAGFGRETLDVLEACGQPIAGVLDDGPSADNLERLRVRGIPFLGGVAEWLGGAPGRHRFLVGINNPRIRERIATTLQDAGHVPATAVHPHASLGTRCEIGAGTVVCAGATLTTNIRLGAHVHLNPQATIGHDSVLEDFVALNPTACVSGDVRIGRRTVVGAQALVLQQLTVGPDCLVGAAACVTKDVPAGHLAVGVPARFRPLEEPA